MASESRRKKPPYSGRIFMGAAIMIAMGLFWLKYLPQYPMEIGLAISIGIIMVLLKDYWYRRS